MRNILDHDHCIQELLTRLYRGSVVSKCLKAVLDLFMGALLLGGKMFVLYEKYLVNHLCRLFFLLDGFKRNV